MRASPSRVSLLPIHDVEVARAGEPFLVLALASRGHEVSYSGINTKLKRNSYLALRDRCPAHASE